MSAGSYQSQSRKNGMIRVQVSDADLRRYYNFAKSAPAAMHAAQRRAINKTLRWLRTHVARAVSQEEKIAVRAVRERIRLKPAKGSASKGEMWFGINPLPARLLGQPRQTATGVSVRGRNYRGAFYKQVHGDTPDIWIRRSSKHFNADDYPDMGSGSGNLDDSLKGRFPLVKAKTNLDSARRHFQHWVTEADARLLELLRQEVNYELHKLLGTA